MKRYLLTFAILALLVGAPLIYAEEARLTVPLPDGGTQVPTTVTEYLKNIFLYGIGLATLLALAQLTFGAVQYTASAGFPALQESSKSRMQSAVVGLLLLIGAITILTMLNRPGQRDTITADEINTAGLPNKILHAENELARQEQLLRMAQSGLSSAIATAEEERARKQGNIDNAIWLRDSLESSIRDKQEILGDTTRPQEMRDKAFQELNRLGPALEAAIEDVHQHEDALARDFPDGQEHRIVQQQRAQIAELEQSVAAAQERLKTLKGYLK